MYLSLSLSLSLYTHTDTHTQTHTHTHTHTQTKSGVVGYEDEEMGPVETETECIARRAHTWIAIIGVCKIFYNV